jgi:hypothetical protein
VREDRPESDKSFGQIGYEAYCERVGWVSVGGDQLPSWPELRTDLQEAWETAAEAILDAQGGVPA